MVGLFADGEPLGLGWGTWAAIGGGAATAIGTAAKVVWGWWTAKEAARTANWQKVVADKDDLIAAKEKQLDVVIKAKDIALKDLQASKDQAIEELSKKLSAKSDEHAAKIQELMTFTLQKLEEWAAKQERLLDRSYDSAAAFTEEVRKLRSGDE